MGLRQLIAVLFLFLAAVANAQQDNTIPTMVEQMPEYPGGNDSLMREIAMKIHYPMECLINNIQGKVFVRFVVNEDGSISNIEAVKGPHPLLKKAAVEAVKTIGKFKPGMEKGKPAKVWYSLPVNFTIQGPDDDIISGSVWSYYTGGETIMNSFIKTNTRIPEAAKKNKLEANILVECKFDKDLKLIPLRVINDIDSVFTSEAVSLINSLPPFSKKIETTDYVNETHILVVYFALPENNAAYINQERSYNFYEKGIAGFQSKNYEEALQNFDKSISLYSLNKTAFYNRGVTKLQLKDKQGACDDFKRAYLLGEADGKQGIDKACK